MLQHEAYICIDGISVSFLGHLSLKVAEGVFLLRRGRGPRLAFEIPQTAFQIGMDSS